MHGIPIRLKKCLTNLIFHSKRPNEMAENKKIRDERIQSWIDARFEKGCVTWELISPDEVKITDQTGDSIIISTDETE